MAPGEDDDLDYGQWWADIYDAINPGVAIDGAEVRLLSELAAGGRVLELGVGTGRVALALRAAGVDVTGLDSSPSMLGRLYAKPGGSALPVLLADMTNVTLEPEFTLTYLVGSTIFGPLTGDLQMATMRTAASAVVKGGAVLVECFVPDRRLLANLPPAEHDANAQVIRSRRQVPGGPVDGLPVAIRYLYPGQLDDIAEATGLQLQTRMGAWDGRPFTMTSQYHVSIYRKT